MGIGEIEIKAYEKAKHILSSYPQNQQQQQQQQQKKKKAIQIKTKGNQYFSTKKYNDALQYYTKAIDIYPLDATFYSNRSATYIQLKLYNDALEDAVICKTFAKPDYCSKAYYRLSIARLALL